MVVAGNKADKNPANQAMKTIFFTVGILEVRGT